MPVQKTVGKWYLHRLSAKNNLSFKFGTLKGMDLSFGSEKFFGGILIRSIKNIKTGEYIEGPCLTVNKLLENKGCKECKELNLKTWPDHDGDAFDLNCELAHLEFTSVLEKRALVTSPRVGLTLNKYDEEKEKYVMADYRFLTYPELCKKQNTLILASLIGRGY